MTSEERFSGIENFMGTMAEHQPCRHEDLRHLTGTFETVASQIGALTNQVETLTSITTEVTGVNRHMINVRCELVESNGLLRQLVESHANRFDRLEGESRN